MTSLLLYTLVPLLLLGFPFVAPETNYVVEVYFVVEPQVLRNYQALGYTSDEALENLKGDVDLAIYQANQYFKSMERRGLNIEIRATKIDYQTDEVFDDCKLVNGNELQVDLALMTFRKWLADKQIHEAYGYDVAVVLTGYDGFGQAEETNVRGYATVGAVCDKTKAVALVEFPGTQDAFHTLAHELAHSLGADHDETASCPPSSGYVMTPLYSSENRNRWEFSPCSVNSINTVIQKLNTEGKNCLTDTSTKTFTFSMSSQNGRDVMDINLICQRAMQDKESYFCGFHNFYNNQPPQGDLVCQYILCAPKKSATCSYKTPTEGMVCDVGKRCSKGKCISASTSFPTPSTVEKDCVFGDLLSGAIYGSDSCEAYMGKQGDYQCYQEGVRESCCRTCGDKRTNIKDCMYGDKNTVCETYNKNLICPTNSDICCKFCNGYTLSRRSAIPVMTALPLFNATIIKTATPTIKKEQNGPKEKFRY